MDNENKQSHFVLWVIMMLIIIYGGGYFAARINGLLICQKLRMLSSTRPLPVPTIASYVIWAKDGNVLAEKLEYIYEPLISTEIKIRRKLDD